MKEETTTIITKGGFKTDVIVFKTQRDRPTRKELGELNELVAKGYKIVGQSSLNLSGGLTYGILYTLVLEK